MVEGIIGKPDDVEVQCVAIGRTQKIVIEPRRREVLIAGYVFGVVNGDLDRGIEGADSRAARRQITAEILDAGCLVGGRRIDLPNIAGGGAIGAEIRFVLDVIWAVITAGIRDAGVR